MISPRRTVGPWEPFPTVRSNPAPPRRGQKPTLPPVVAAPFRNTSPCQKRNQPDEGSETGHDERQVVRASLLDILTHPPLGEADGHPRGGGQHSREHSHVPRRQLLGEGVVLWVRPEGTGP